MWVDKTYLTSFRNKFRTIDDEKVYSVDDAWRDMVNCMPLVDVEIALCYHVKGFELNTSLVPFLYSRYSEALLEKEILDEN